jgi:uncharacterized repeat protein (TIGR03803 family)
LKRTSMAAMLLAVAAASPTFAGYTDINLTSFQSSNGAVPVPQLVLSGSTLYGATNSGDVGAASGSGGDGVVYSLPVTGGTPTILAAFSGADGAGPSSSPILSGSTLYGTTTQGGASSDGVIYSLPVGGGTPTVLASFNGPNGDLPIGTLTLSGSTLYGTTRRGGASFFPPAGNDGEVFSEPITGGSPTVLASFVGVNGAQPASGVIVSGSTLYGTTYQGGANNDGEVFSLPKTGGSPTVLASFNSTNGLFPIGGLLLSGTTLYGTTYEGGAYNDGEIFSLPVGGGTPSVLLSFNGVDGQDAGGPLIADASGNLYGTTALGGANGGGTAFEFNPTTLALTTLYSFNEIVSDNGFLGTSAQSLIFGPNGNLYGVTADGGDLVFTGGDQLPTGYGTVFELTVPEPTTVSLFAIGSTILFRRGSREKKSGCGSAPVAAATVAANLWFRGLFGDNSGRSACGGRSRRRGLLP